MQAPTLTEPGEICRLPRGIVFKGEPGDGPARGPVREKYGGALPLPGRVGPQLGGDLVDPCCEVAVSCEGLVLELADLIVVCVQSGLHRVQDVVAGVA